MIRKRLLQFMILARSTGKKALSLFLCLTICFSLFSVPAQASLAPVVSTVGALETVASALMSAGIFVRDTAWAFTLPGMIQAYNKAHPDSQISLSDLVGTLRSGAIYVSKDVWNPLKSFVDWVKGKVPAGTENESVTISYSEIGYPLIPSVSETPSGPNAYLGGFKYARWIQKPVNGTYKIDYYHKAFNQSGGTIYYRSSFPTGYYIIFPGATDSVTYYILREYIQIPSGASPVYVSGFTASEPYDFVRDGKRYFGRYAYSSYQTTDEITLYCPSSNLDVLSYIYSISLGEEVQEVEADITTLTPLPAPSSNEEYVSIQVSNTNENALQYIQTQLDSLIGDVAQIKSILSIPVEVSPDIEILPDGQIILNPEVIDKKDVTLSPSDFTIGSLKDFFPFSIPWDIHRVIKALDVEPARPNFEGSIPSGLPDGYPQEWIFKVDLPEQMDSFMSIVRSLELCASYVGVLWGLYSIFL